MYRLFLVLIASLLFSFSVEANEIEKYVKKQDFSNVSIFILNNQTNDIIYQKYENQLHNPASILKPITFNVAYNILGEDYKFETSLLKDKENNIYVKLGGDVLLKQNDLNSLISKLKNYKINKIYIDDSIFKIGEYPQSWLIEDKWPKQREITPYIIDRNYTQIGVTRSSLAKKVDIVQNGEYKIPVVNELQIGDEHKIKVEQPYGADSPIISLQGTVSEDCVINIPVLSPEINFNVKLRQAIEKNKINYLGVIVNEKAPSGSVEIASVGHSIKAVSKLVLHNSDNFASEVVSKVAAAKYLGIDNVAFDDVLKMYDSILGPELAQEESIQDSSGVSRENLLSAKTILKFYRKILSDENYSNLLQTSMQGTMAERLNFLKNNIKVKTGTLRNLSSICGVLKTRNDNEVVFVSVVQDKNTRKALMKNFENRLISIIYKNY